LADFAALNEEELRVLCEFLYRRTGMIFNESKRYYVERRVFERMAQTGAGSFHAYFVRLRLDEHEVEQFVNAFTVNETYFYREEHQLKCLANDILPELVQGRRTDVPIRIWSVPCSTGEEPYSIAIWLLENWRMVDDFQIEIVGSDIDTKALEQAVRGVYGNRALMRLSPPLQEKYFSAAGPDQWKILDDLRGSVTFTRVNIMEDRETRTQGQFDVIFCRNVLIYFDDASRRIAAENLFENLVPGGIICLGHSESMSRISPLFEVRRFSDAIVYQRPSGGKHG
jgi:chemotaxis protein methyltransferase CheR